MLILSVLWCNCAPISLPVTSIVCVCSHQCLCLLPHFLGLLHSPVPAVTNQQMVFLLAVLLEQVGPARVLSILLLPPQLHRCHSRDKRESFSNSDIQLSASHSPSSKRRRRGSSSSWLQSSPSHTRDSELDVEEADFCRLVHWMLEITDILSLLLTDNKCMQLWTVFLGMRAQTGIRQNYLYPVCIRQQQEWSPTKSRDDTESLWAKKLDKFLFPFGLWVRRFYQPEDDDTLVVLSLPKSAEGFLGDQLFFRFLGDVKFTSNKAELPVLVSLINTAVTVCANLVLKWHNGSLSQLLKDVSFENCISVCNNLIFNQRHLFSSD